MPRTQTSSALCGRAIQLHTCTSGSHQRSWNILVFTFEVIKKEEFVLNFVADFSFDLPKFYSFGGSVFHTFLHSFASYQCTGTSLFFRFSHSQKITNHFCFDLKVRNFLALDPHCLKWDICLHFLALGLIAGELKYFGYGADNNNTRTFLPAEFNLLSKIFGAILSEILCNQLDGDFYILWNAHATASHKMFY